MTVLQTIIQGLEGAKNEITDRRIQEPDNLGPEIRKPEIRKPESHKLEVAELEISIPQNATSTPTSVRRGVSKRVEDPLCGQAAPETAM
jgi:hypothetical protein